MEKTYNSLNVVCGELLKREKPLQTTNTSIPWSEAIQNFGLLMVGLAPTINLGLGFYDLAKDYLDKTPTHFGLTAASLVLGSIYIGMVKKKED